MPKILTPARCRAQATSSRKPGRHHLGLPRRLRRNPQISFWRRMHAEHYFRVRNAANEGHQHRAMPPTAAADLETERAEEDGSEMAGPVRTSLSNRQPYSA